MDRLMTATADELLLGTAVLPCRLKTARGANRLFCGRKVGKAVINGDDFTTFRKGNKRAMSKLIVTSKTNNMVYTRLTTRHKAWQELTRFIDTLMLPAFFPLYDHHLTVKSHRAFYSLGGFWTTNSTLTNEAEIRIVHFNETMEDKIKAISVREILKI